MKRKRRDGEGNEWNALSSMHGVAIIERAGKLWRCITVVQSASVSRFQFVEHHVISYVIQNIYARISY